MTPERIAKLKAASAAWRAARPLEVRFWEKVDKRGPNECWPWIASKHFRGYGQIWDGNGKVIRAHRASLRIHGMEPPPYEPGNGYSPVVDHICRNVACVNPAHLRVVLQAENCGPLARPTPFEHFRTRTHCDNGHELSGENVHWYYGSNGKPTRKCLVCYRVRFPGTKQAPNTKETARKPKSRA